MIEPASLQAGFVSQRAEFLLISFPWKEGVEMEFVKHPQGDIYDINIKNVGPITIPFGAEFFSVEVAVKNCGSSTWDTSDNLRLAVWLVEPMPKDVNVPHRLVEGRLNFPQQFIPPMEETVFRVDLNINLIPKGSYLLEFDLVVEQKYFLANTGGKRQSRQVDIIDRDAAGISFHSDFTITSRPLQRKWLADLTPGSTTSAFQLTESHLAIQPINGTARHTDPELKQRLQHKKIVVKFNWWPFFFRHYAHFLEFIICLYAISKEFAGEVDELVILIGDQEFTTGNNPDVQRFLLNSLFKNWLVIPHLDDVAIEDATFVIDFDGRRQKTPINRIIVDHLDLISLSLESFKARCIGNVADLVRRPDRKRAVYAKRGGSRSFSEKAESELFSIFAEFGYEIVHIDFGKLTIQEQINAAMGASVMFGVHGNNLTSCIWLPKDAALVEVFPVGFQAFDFQVLCEISGTSYLGIEARERGFVHRDLTRLPDWTFLGEPYNSPQHHQDDIDFIPGNVLRSFLRKLS